MDKSSKIFVAGGSGMVGSAILRKLLEKGYSHIVTNYHKKKPNLSSVEWHQLDLTNPIETQEFFQKQRPDYVFLAAAKVGGILANNTYKADFIYQNLAIALNVIHASFKFGVKKLLNLGSSCIYPKLAPQPIKEEYLLTGPLEPTNEPYAIAKISAIKLCRYFNEQYNTNFISVMPTNLYGPNDNFDLLTSHVLPSLIRKFHLAKCLREKNWQAIETDLNQRPLQGITGHQDRQSILSVLKVLGVTEDAVAVWGTGNVRREFLHVDDLAQACVFLMETVDAKALQSLSADFFLNVGTGEDLTLKELAHGVQRIVGFEGAIDWDLSKPEGTPRKLLDVSRIHKLGWKHRVSIEQGIQETYDWYRRSLFESNL